MIIKVSQNKNLYLFHKVSLLGISLSIKQLSVMLKSGLGMTDALQVLAKQTPDPKLKNTYQKVLNDVQSGRTLGQSMKIYPGIFPPIVTSITEVGEEGASLETNLGFVSDYLRHEYELQRKIKGAMFYPIIIVLLTLAELLGMVYFILPKLESLFTAFEDIPRFTQIVLDIAAFLRSNMPAIIVVILIAILIVHYLLKTVIGKHFKDKLALKFPIIKELNKNIILSMLARTLRILLQSGIPLENAVLIAQSTIGNSVYESILSKVHTDIKSGRYLSDTLSVHMDNFSPTYVKLIEIGEQTGTLEENLEYLYDLYASEVQDMTNNLATIIEPLLLIFMGLIIGLLAIIIIGPIYQLTGSINA